MKKKTAAIVMIFTLLAGTQVLGPVLAAPQGEGFQGPRQRHGRGFGRQPFLSPRFLEEVLQLTPEQLDEVDTLKEELRATVRPLTQQGPELRQALRAKLEEPNPDPTEVGELVISSRDLRQQLQDAQQSFQASFEAMLTPEQLQKLAEFKERRSGRRGSRNRPRKKP